ncbi:hypothetical protein AAHE18_07G173200 [Arachis hypogaea]
MAIIKFFMIYIVEKYFYQRMWSFESSFLIICPSPHLMQIHHGLFLYLTLFKPLLTPFMVVLSLFLMHLMHLMHFMLLMILMHHHHMRPPIIHLPLHLPI